MDRRSDGPNLHQRMEAIVAEMLERELTLKDGVRELESIFFDQAERKFKGNRTRMAEALGIHRNTLAKGLKNKKIRR